MLIRPTTTSQMPIPERLLGPAAPASASLSLSPAPAGFDQVDAADGSMTYRGPSWVKRRLESNQVKLLAIRHGQSQSNAADDILLYGQSESPLTDKGIQQARDCAVLLYDQLGGDNWLKTCLDAPEKLPIFVSSPLSRTMDSSHILTDYLKDRIEALGGSEARERLSPFLEVKSEPRILETNFGRYEKRKLQDLEAAYPDFVNHWRPPEGMGTDFLHRFPGGESRADVMRRGISFLNGLAQSYPGRTVVMMSHSECILGLRTALGAAPVIDGKVRAETSTIGNARPYWLVGGPDSAPLLPPSTQPIRNFSIP